MKRILGSIAVGVVALSLAACTKPAETTNTAEAANATEMSNAEMIEETDSAMNVANAGEAVANMGEVAADNISNAH